MKNEYDLGLLAFWIIVATVIYVPYVLRARRNLSLKKGSEDA